MATIFGTLVSYFDNKAKKEVTKEFWGDNHGVEAVEFCNKRVQGFTDDQYKRMKPEDQAKLERRRVACVGANVQAGDSFLWMRRRPLWGWFNLTPMLRTE